MVGASVGGEICTFLGLRVGGLPQRIHSDEGMGQWWLHQGRSLSVRWGLEGLTLGSQVSVFCVKSVDPSR